MTEAVIQKTVQNYLNIRRVWYIVAIKKDKKWLNNIMLKAKEKNISSDSCINLDTRWMAEQELKRRN